MALRALQRIAPIAENFIINFAGLALSDPDTNPLLSKMNIDFAALNAATALLPTANQSKAVGKDPDLSNYHVGHAFKLSDPPVGIAFTKSIKEVMLCNFVRLHQLPL